MSKLRDDRGEYSLASDRLDKVLLLGNVFTVEISTAFQHGSEVEVAVGLVVGCLSIAHWAAISCQAGRWTVEIAYSCVSPQTFMFLYMK